MALTPEEKIESTLRRASSLIRRVDLGAAFFTSAAAAVLLLLDGILFDHFLPGGMSRSFRLVYASAACAVFLGVTLWRFFLPVRRRVNPLYCASKLEQAHPNLKNGLVNWLLIRGAKKSRPDLPFTRKTAEAIPPDAASDAVDMRPLVRSAFLFIGALILLFAYLVAARRSCLVSAARVLMPTAEIAQPQKIRFRAVRPGNARVRRGEETEIAAEFDDQPGDEVRFVYSTADGRLTDASLTMTPETDRTFRVRFPETGEGVQEDILYTIQVVDGGKVAARSAEYRLAVLPALKFSAEKIVFLYPEYTRLEPKTVEGEEEIDAWEGTEVTLTARSNYPLARAEWIPDFKRREGLKMTISPDDPTRAEVRFTLEAGRYTSYRLWCVDDEGNANLPDPEDAHDGVPSRSITVRVDPPPVAVWNEAPRGTPLGVAEHGSLPLSMTGTDELFGLARAELELFWYRAGNPAEKTPVTVDLTGRLLAPGVDRRAPQTIAFDFSPAANGIPAGATVECRGVLYDNRPEEPNRSETETLTVTVARDEPPAPDESDSASGPGGEEGGGSPSGGESGRQEPNESKGNGENSQSDSAGNNAEKNDEKNESSEGGSSEGESSSDAGTPPPAENEPQGGEEDNAEGTGESAGDAAPSDRGGAGSESGARSGTDGGAPEDAAPSDRRGDRQTDAAGQGRGASASSEDESEESPQPDGEAVDPETEPADAFDAILDFSGLDVDSAPSDAAPQGRGTGVSSPETEKNPADIPPEEREKIKSAPGDPPDGPRRSDPSAGEIPADAPRENGKVDPNTRNYMATAGQGSEGAQVPSDAQIRPDPNIAGDPAETPEGEEGRETTTPSDAGGEGSPDRGEGAPNRNDPAPEAGPPTGESGGALPTAGEGNADDGSPLSGGSGSAPGKERQGEAAAADRANLEYARKATDLVLNYLDEELKKGPNPKLLDRLGWTEAELRAFREKWAEMKARAGETPSGGRRYDQELLDLGLRPKGVRLSGRGADRKSADSARNADRTPPPDDVAGRLREYNEAIGRSEESPSR